MAKPRPRTRSTFASNLRKLAKDAGDTNRALAHRAGISAKQVNNILNERSAPTTESAEALARAYGLQGWMLLLADLPLETLKTMAVGRLVDAYLHAPPDTQRYLLSVAERDARS